MYELAKGVCSAIGLNVTQVLKAIYQHKPFLVSKCMPSITQAKSLKILIVNLLQLSFALRLQR